MIINRIKAFILHADISFVILLPIVIGFLFLVLVVRLEGWLQPDHPLNWGIGLGGSFFAWFSGLGGVAQIIRKETYGPMRSYRGFLGVASGVIMVVACWGTGAVILISWIIETFLSAR